LRIRVHFGEDGGMTRLLASTRARLVVTMLAAAAVSGAGKPPAKGEWRYYAADNGSTKYSPLDQINTGNVSKLRVAWRRPQIDAEFAAAHPKMRLTNNYRSTPIMVDGLLYATDAVGIASAFDPETGKTVWQQKIAGEFAGNPGLGGALRAVAYWQEGAEARILTYNRQFLYALDPKTGETLQTFGEAGRVDLSVNGQYLWNAPPLVVRDLVIVGSSMPDQDSASKKSGAVGELRAYDVRTGKHRWTFRVIPGEGEPGTKSWDDESWRFVGAGNVWAPMSADDELGYVYLPTTSATNDMYGGHRPGNNLYANSVVCLDARTGERVFLFQTVQHAVWD